MPDAAVAVVQVCTATLVVTAGAGQVMVLKLLPAVGAAGVHDGTPTFVATAVPQVVVTQLLPLLAAAGVQLATKLAGGLFTVHKVAVKLLPTTGDTGVQVCTGVTLPKAGAGH